MIVHKTGRFVRPVEQWDTVKLEGYVQRLTSIHRTREAWTQSLAEVFEQVECTKEQSDMWTRTLNETASFIARRLDQGDQSSSRAQRG